MIYTIIAEPRSGGTALMDWIEKSLPNYVIAQEPYFIGNDNWVEGEDTNDIEWINKYKNLFIREIYRQDRTVDSIVKRSDKTLCLYRENWYEQIKSILFQELNNYEGYMTTYQKKDVDKLVTDDMILNRFEFFNKTKIEFKKWAKENNLILVSYEELYYGNGIEVIKELFDIQSVIKFPLNMRHLKDEDNNEIGLMETPATPTPTPTPTITPTPTPTKRKLI
jgi:hypothetical protein